jgi:hypothetical protein
MAVGGPLSGKTSDEKDFESIELDRARTTVALTPKNGDVVWLVPWCNAQAATASLEEFTAPGPMAAKGK